MTCNLLALGFQSRKTITVHFEVLEFPVPEIVSTYRALSLRFRQYYTLSSPLVVNCENSILFQGNMLRKNEGGGKRSPTGKQGGRGAVLNFKPCKQLKNRGENRALGILTLLDKFENPSKFLESSHVLREWPATCSQRPQH